MLKAILFKINLMYKRSIYAFVMGVCMCPGDDNGEHTVLHKT